MRKNSRHIIVPADYYDEAMKLKQRIFQEKKIEVPLWWCMMTIEKANPRHNRDDLDFYGRKVR